MPGDVCGCHKYRQEAIWVVEARDAAGAPRGHCQPSMAQNRPAQHRAASTHPWALLSSPEGQQMCFLSCVPRAQSGDNSRSCPWQGHPQGAMPAACPGRPTSPGALAKRTMASQSPGTFTLAGSQAHSTHSDGSQSIPGLLRTNSDHSAEQPPKTQAPLIPKSTLQGGSQERLLAPGSPPPQPPRPHPHPMGMQPFGL